MVFIESTAEGQDGHFYKISKRAEALMQSNKKLNPKDYKFHFYPWHGESKYITSPDDVIITSKDNEYFDRIEGEADCIISIEQRAWWVMTRDSEFSGEEEKMWQEYPSTILSGISVIVTARAYGYIKRSGRKIISLNT